MLKPCMSDTEIDFFKAILLKTKKYLEYGSGGSTYLVTTIPSIETIITVEGAKKWINILIKEESIKSALDSKQLTIHYVDYNANENNYSKPADLSKSEVFHEYSDIVKKYPVNYFDTILIDGRFRVACICKLWKYIGTDTRVLVHDYTNRTYYHSVEKFFKKVKEQSTLVLLQKREDCNQEELEKTIEMYEKNPE